MKHKLFLMKPGFHNLGMGPFYCGDSVSIEGMLAFFPELRRQIDIEYIEFSKPRRALVELLGEDGQSVPVLVLHHSYEGDGIGISVSNSHRLRFIDDEKDIRGFLSAQFNMPRAT